MFLRVKEFGKNNQRKYYYIVENVRVRDKPKQKVIKYLGTLQNILDKIEKVEKSTRRHQ